MLRPPGVNHPQAIRAFEKPGYTVGRQGKHVIMSNGSRILVVPRNNPIKPLTMGAIVSATGLTVDEFRKYL